MAGTEVISKRVAITKSNARMVAIVGAASFVTIFCLIAAKTALGQNEYNTKVIVAEQASHNQLLSDTSAYSTLQQNYQSFEADQTNIIGGQSNGTGNNGGTNSKLILDALPPTYDFPALASSIEAILSQQKVDITGIGGTDNQLTEQSNTTSPNPSPVPMAFDFSLSNMNYTQVGSLFTYLQQSIRPIAIDNISISGGGNNMTVSVQAHTYYQPGISFSVTQKAVQ